MKFPILIACLLFSLIAFAQQPKTIIKFCPLALLDDTSFPTIQGGIEIKLNNRISWYNEAGIKYRTSILDQTDTSFTKSSGFKLKTEVRYYLKKEYRIKRHTLKGFYFAANAFFTRDVYNKELTYYTNTDTTLRNDAYNSKKKVLGLNVLLGMQQKLSNKFMIDIYLGIGIRYIDISNYHEEYNKNTDNLFHTIDLNIHSIREESDATAGPSVLPNLTGGLRLCYIL
jgi:hypothetical protein